MKNLWLSKERVMELTGCSAKWVEMQVATGKLHARETRQRGRNGKPLKEYCAASLPQDAQNKLAGGDVASVAAQGTAITLSPLFAGHQSTERVVLVDPRDQAKAAERLQIIQPILDYRASQAGSYERNKYLQLKISNGRNVTTVELLEQYLSELHGVSARSIRRWASSYRRNGGDVALADKRRADKNQSRWAKQNPELATLAAYVFLERKLSATVAHEYVRARALEVEAAVPSYETVRAFLNNPNEVSVSMKMLALQGQEKYEATFSPFLRRAYTDVASNEIWESDHMIFDVLGQNDIFDDCDLQPIRMHLTTMFDYHSRYVTGVAFSRNGSSLSLATAFRRAATAHGIPYGFYCDNGKDYKKFTKGAQRHELDEAERMAEEMHREGVRSLTGDGKGGSVMQRFNIAVTFCLPYHAQSKGVERFHNSLHNRFDKVWPSYTGPAAHLRPDSTHAMFARHKGLMMLRKRGQMDSAQVAAESDIPLCSELVQAFMNWLEVYYHAEPQSGEGMNGRSPAQVFVADRWKDARPAPSPALLSSLLMEREIRKVDSCAVSLQGRRYVPSTDDLHASAIMHEYTTRKVLVAYDPCDMQSVDIYDTDGHLLCTLQAELLMRQSGDKETRDRISASMQQRRSLMRSTRESLAGLSRAVASSGQPAHADAQPDVLPLLATGTDAITQRSQLKPQRTVTVRQPLYTHDLVQQLLED